MSKHTQNTSAASKHRKLLTPVNMTMIGVMTALATVIYLFFPEIPIIPGVEYLKIDLSDFPAVLLGVTVHPLCGVLAEIFKNVVHLMKTTTMGIGEIMNIGVGSVIILTMSGLLHLFSKLFSKWFPCERLHPLPYFVSVPVAVFSAIAAGWLLNWVLTPLFYYLMGIPLTTELLFAGVFSSTVLNGVKALINLLPFYPVFYAVNRALRHF